MTTFRIAPSFTHAALTWWQHLTSPAPMPVARLGLLPVALRRRQLVRLAAMPGQLLCATGGDLWVTFDGDTADQVIEAGQSWRVPLDRPLLVQALADAQLSKG